MRYPEPGRADISSHNQRVSRSDRRPEPLEKYLRRKPRQTRVVVSMSVVMIMGLSWADRSGWFLYQGGDQGRYDGKAFRVAEVIDGDTLDVVVPDGSSPVTRVRLWGIDTPEIAKPDLGLTAQPFADEATQRVRELCEGDDVVLHLEPHQTRGKYGRLVAYVQTADGSVLNETLLIEGFAKADRRFSHRWNQRYVTLESRARHNVAGMWGGR